MEKLFEIKDLSCSYDKTKVVLEIKHLVIPQGKKVFIVGESGIGKSTILETLGMMSKTIVDDSASVFKFYSNSDINVNLKELWNDPKRLSNFRLNNYSFIFQSTNFMKNFTAYENICFTRMLQGYSRKESFDKAKTVLSSLDLSLVDEKRMAHTLSGGQQQRLAFARAVLPDFTVLFGDEPTGNLDPENAKNVMQILTEKLDSLNGASAIIVSHDIPLALRFADVIIKINKRERPDINPDTKEHDIFGYIDDSFVYMKDDCHGSNWSNGTNVFSNLELEEKLRNNQ